MLCSIGLIFLTAFFPQNSTSVSVLRDACSNRMLNLACVGTRPLILSIYILTTYQPTSSTSSQRWKSCQNLPTFWALPTETVVSVSQCRDLLVSFAYNSQTVNTQIGICNASLNRLGLPLPNFPWSVTRTSLTQQQVHSAVGPDILLHGKTLFVLPTTDSDNIALPLFTLCIISYFCAHSLLTGSAKLAFIIRFQEFLTAGGWEGDIQLPPDTARRYLGGAMKMNQ